MSKILISILLIVVSANIYCQSKIITGRVFDKYGEPLTGVSVYQEYSNKCNFTDYEGTFHLFLDSEVPQSISFSYIGYQLVEIQNIDTIMSPLNVTMFEDTQFANIDSLHAGTIHKFGFITFLQLDFIYNDFSEFRSLLNDYSIDWMNLSSGIISFELAGTYKRYYAGINWGFMDNNDYNHDSLDIEFNSNQIGLHFGYNLINSKRFLVTPKVAVKWNNYRLINNDKERKIPMAQYVADRDLDIRFNQLTGFAGLNLSYKIYNFNLWKFLMSYEYSLNHMQYWTVGVYGGYCFKLNDKPWIYSKRNRLISDSKIGIGNYNVGMNFSFNFE